MPTRKPPARTKPVPPTDNEIDQVIHRHLGRFAKPGVVSVRPGLRITGGMLTKDPAIVVSVRQKLRDLPPEEQLPAHLEGVRVDVRPVSPAEALRATAPEAFAQQLAGIPRGNVPIELQTANFPLERNLAGHLVSPLVDNAVARVRPRRPGEPKPGVAAGPVYQKLPADTFKPVTGNFKVTCFASPDAGWPTLRSFLDGVASTLSVGMYEFTAPHIVDVVRTRMAGKALNLVLDDPNYDTTMREQTNDATHATLAASLGKRMTFAWAAEGADKHNALHLFPAAYHIKVAVADSRALFLSSGNFNTSNQPDFDPIAAPSAKDAHTSSVSDRDWHVIVEHEGLASTFERVLLRDLEEALPGQRDASPPVLKGNGNAVGKAYGKFFAPKSVSGRMTVQAALTPDNYAGVILPLIRSARERLWMQTQYIKPSSRFEQDLQLPVGQRTILEQLLDAVRGLIDGKTDVRIIVDSRVTPTMIEYLSKVAGLSGDCIRRQHHVHNKGMIVDGKTAVVGSQNWSTEGVDSNRDASVVITHPQVAAYWAQLFDYDWRNMTLPHEDPTPP